MGTEIVETRIRPLYPPRCFEMPGGHHRVSDGPGHHDFDDAIEEIDEVEQVTVPGAQRSPAHSGDTEHPDDACDPHTCNAHIAQGEVQTTGALDEVPRSTEQEDMENPWETWSIAA